MAKYVPPQDAKELHLPGYNFCGPGTNVNRRLRSKVQPINALDRACLLHDLDTESRGPQRARTKKQIRASDNRLKRTSLRLAKSSADKNERKAAWIVYKAMQANKWRPSRRD